MKICDLRETTPDKVGCLRCGMLALRDPWLHEERYGHWPEVIDTDGERKRFSGEGALRRVCRCGEAGYHYCEFTCTECGRERPCADHDCTGCDLTLVMVGLVACHRQYRVGCPVHDPAGVQ